MNYLPFEVTIKSRDGILYQGQALSISSTNAVGNFDVVGNHANFVTPVREFLKVQTSQGQFKDIPVKTGLLHAAGNVVDIFVGLVVLEKLVDNSK